MHIPGLRGFKLSSNENPFEPLPEVLQAASRALQLHRYSEPTALPLREMLAEFHGVSADSIEAGTGSLDVLNRILGAFAGTAADGRPDEVVFAWRSFESYPISVRMAGARGIPIPLTADGRHDLPAMADAVTDRTRVVILCSPNNPTGPALTMTELDTFMSAVPAGVLVVLDQAYAEFERGADMIDDGEARRRHPNLMVLRTFSKAHGLADLRVGYAVADGGIIEMIRRGAVPFGVSGVAQAAAIASMRCRDEVLGRVERIVAYREQVLGILREQGWDVPDAQGNFFWLPLGQAAKEFADAAGRRALAVRDFPGDGVRISVGRPEANVRVLELCAQFLSVRRSG
jgi:histidinol-phosphate aminotransferase